jgi:hypothetical protein
MNSIIFLFLACFMFFFMNCTHDAMGGKIVSFRGNHANQNIYNARYHSFLSGMSLNPMPYPVTGLSPDGMPFVIYGMGFLCFITWGWIRRKKESSTNQLNV